MNGLLVGYFLGVASRPRPAETSRPKPAYAPPAATIDEAQLRDQAVRYGWQFPEEFNEDGTLFVDTDRLYDVGIKLSREGRFDYDVARWVYPNHLMWVTRDVNGAVEAAVLGCNRA